MKKIIILLCMIVLLGYNVFGFAVSTPYYKDRPLILGPGESKDVVLTMQNMAGATEDLKVEAKIISGTEIAEITDKETIYDVPAGRDDIKTTLKITIPKYATPGEAYRVEVDFKTINQKKEGMVSMSTGVKTGFDVITSEAVKEPERSNDYKPLFLAGGMIVIVILIVLGLRVYSIRRKKK